MASPLTVPLQLLWLCLLVERVGLVALCLQARFFALWPAAFIDLCRSRLEAVAVAWALVLPPTFCLPGGGWVVSGPWYLPFFHCCPDLRQVFGYAVPGLLAVCVLPGPCPVFLCAVLGSAGAGDLLWAVGTLVLVPGLLGRTVLDFSFVRLEAGLAVCWHCWSPRLFRLS